MEKLKGMLNFHDGFSVECKGKSGGLILLWAEEVDLSNNSYSVGHIDATIKEPDGWWRFLGFYGNPCPTKREES